MNEIRGKRNGMAYNIKKHAFANGKGEEVAANTCIPCSHPLTHDHIHAEPEGDEAVRSKMSRW